MSKSNKCPIDSSSSNERDFKHNHYQYHLHHSASPQKKIENPLSHICKYLDVTDNGKSSKENVELALEVEINESLKHVLTSPERNSSELLDVTIIRPSDSDTTHETTVALNKEEVRDFISLVEQHHRHQLSDTHYAEKSKEIRSRNEVESNESGRKEKPPKSRLYKGHHSESKPKKSGNYEEENQERKSQEKNSKIDENAKHVYATINTFDKLKQALPCQNKNRDCDKPGTPCMCQHCGIVGVLVQSQKGPVAPFPPLEDHHGPSQQQRNAPRPREQTPTRKDQRQRRVCDVRKKKSLDQLQLLREINARIKSLEKRIAVQEETAVPREYLKHILHKVLLQYNLKTSMADGKMRNNSTQYSSKNIAEPGTAAAASQKYGGGPDHKDARSKYYQVHTVFEDHPNWLDYATNRDDDLKRTNDKLGSPRSSRDPYWFWGEEVVKPGCDLKNKILKLLDDKLHRAPQERARNESPPRRVENVPHPYFNNNRPDNPTAANQEGIKIERDEKTIFLSNVDHLITAPKNFNYLQQANQLPVNEFPKEDETLCNKPGRDPVLPSNTNKFSNFRNFFPKPNYPFDIKKTLDDTTFKKNIEAQKEKNKDKSPGPPMLEEKFYNAYACHSITTESQASMDFILQKLRNNAKVLESGLTREKEAQLEAKFKIPNVKELPVSVIKENLNRGFRGKKETTPTTGSVDVKFVNPRIRQWSEESSTSDDKIVRQKAKNMASERQERVGLEKKESLIYKLDFLKNLAKNKSSDQSRVLNKIWTQAKNTAKSKKDAVYIKIPFKNLNTCEGQDNLIEMHLTLEELETVVKTAKVSSSGVNVKVQSYKSSSAIDFGQRKHEELKHANRELLKRRQLSAKTNKQRDRR